MFEATGDIGELWVGYRFAASIRKWYLTGEFSEIGQLGVGASGVVVTADTYWSTYTKRPFTLKLWMGKCWWVWKSVQVEGDIEVGANISMRLAGNPETEEAWYGQEQIHP